MPVAVRDATSVVTTSSPTMVIPKPTLADNDILFLIGTARASATATTPDGFTALLDVHSGSATSSHVRCVVYYKTVPTASTEPADYTITWNANAFGDGYAVSISGQSATAPVNVFATAADVDGNSTVASPAATTTVNNCLALRLATMQRSGGFAAGSFTPTDATELEDPGNSGSGNRIAGGLGYEMIASAGTTGTEVWTVTAADFSSALGVTIAISPPTFVTDAGPDQTVVSGQYVTLSSDTLGATTWAWLQTAGTPTVILDAANLEDVHFFAPTGPATLVIQLTAGNGTVSNADTVTITVTDPAVNPSLPLKRRSSGAWV